MWQRLIIVIVIGLLGWQAVVMGIAQMQSERLAAIYAGWATPWVDAVDSILPDAKVNLTADGWASLTDQALVRGNQTDAEAYAWRAVNRNISSGRAVARLLNIRDLQHKMEAGDRLAALASRLWPMHSDALLRISAHWIAREDLKQLMPVLNTLMTQTGEFNAQLYPALHQLAQAEDVNATLKQYVAQAPTWWPAFFAYLCAQEKDLSLIRTYYQIRQQADKPLLKSEQIPYVNRLLQAQQWQQARTIWAQTLEPEQQQLATDGLYDGGFEGEIHNEGFAWYFSPTPLVAIDTGLTGGIDGKRALHIAFKAQKKPINFQQVWQRLVLPSGDYTLKLRYRLDSFNTGKGLQWRIRCDAGDTTLLGESQPLTGSGNWQALSVNFSVPASDKDTQPGGCATQMLRLEAASQYAHERLFEGGLWFDDVEVKAVK